MHPDDHPPVVRTPWPLCRRSPRRTSRGLRKVASLSYWRALSANRQCFATPDVVRPVPRACPSLVAPSAPTPTPLELLCKSCTRAARTSLAVGMRGFCGDQLPGSVLLWPRVWCGLWGLARDRPCPVSGGGGGVTFHLPNFVRRLDIVFAGWTRCCCWCIAVYCKSLAWKALHCTLHHAEHLVFRNFSHDCQ